MKKTLTLLLIVIITILLLPKTSKAIVEPTTNFYVNDYADILSQETEDFITTKMVENIQDEFKETHDFLVEEDISNLDTAKKSTVSTFLNDFSNLEEIVNKINEELSIRILQNKVNDSVDELEQFNTDLNLV